MVRVRVGERLVDVLLVVLRQYPVQVVQAGGGFELAGRHVGADGVEREPRLRPALLEAAGVVVLLLPQACGVGGLGLAELVRRPVALDLPPVLVRRLPLPLTVDHQPGGDEDDHEHPGGDGGGLPRAAADVPPRPLPRRGRAGGDRLAVQPPPQVVGQRPGGGVAAGRRLRQALQADRPEVAGQARDEAAGRGGVGPPHLLQRRHHVHPAERRTAGQHLVQDRPEPVHVRCRADRPHVPGRLLRRHVARRPHHRPARGQPGRHLVLLGEAEVGQLQRPVLRPQHVRRLQVAVDDAALVGVVNSPGEHLGLLGRPPRLQHLVAQLLVQAPALGELQHQVRAVVGRPDLVDAGDVRVVELGGDLGLAAEPARLELVRHPQHLDRHRPRELQVECPVDPAHPTLAELGDDLVVADPCGPRQARAGPGGRVTTRAVVRGGGEGVEGGARGTLVVGGGHRESDRVGER